MFILLLFLPMMKCPKIKAPEAEHFVDDSFKSFQLVNEVSNK